MLTRGTFGFLQGVLGRRNTTGRFGRRLAVGVGRPRGRPVRVRLRAEQLGNALSGVSQKKNKNRSCARRVVIIEFHRRLCVCVF